MGHELTNLFILAGSLFLLFIGYLAYQLASTEKGTRNLLLFFVVCILIFIFSIHFLMYRFENASEAQPKIIEKYEIVRGKTEQLIQGKGFGLLTVYNMSLSENNQFGFYYYNQDGDIERMSINFDDIKIKEVEEDTARLEVYVEQETNTYCSVLLGCETETKPISNEQYMLIVPKGTITGSDELNLLLKQFKKLCAQEDSFTNDSYIFFGKHFNKMIPQYLIRTTLEKHLDLCHLKRMTPHDFRHTYVSMLIHEGYDDTSIAELIGDSVLTVRTVYAHMLPSRRKDVMVVLDKSIPKNLISI